MVKLKDFFPEELKHPIKKEKISSNNVKKLQEKDNIEYAFPTVHKLPLQTKRNVLSAFSQFLNVKNVTEVDRAEAFKKIIKKAELFDVCTMVFNKQYESYLQKCSTESNT